MRAASLTFLLPLLASLAFVALGLPDGLLGVAWPSMRAYFGLPLDALGGLLVSFTGGYVVSSFTGGRLLARLGLGRVLVLSCVATGICLLGYASAERWRVVIALAFLAGLGAGGIDAGINTYAATSHGPRMLNWLHACYGIGATGGPAIMTAVLAASRPWQHGYALVGGAQLGFTVAFLATVHAWPAPAGGAGATRRGQAATAVRPSIGMTLRLAVSRWGILLFLAYTGQELAIGAWAFTLLTEGRGVSMMMAGSWVSLYWGGLTAGRVLGVALASRLSIDTLIGACLAGLTAGLALLAAGDELLQGKGHRRGLRLLATHLESPLEELGIDGEIRRNA